MSETGDGVRSMIPRESMLDPARRLRDIDEMRPGAPLYHSEDTDGCLLKSRREMT